MSSSIGTNVGPREGSQGLSSMLDSPMGGGARLSPVAGTLNKVISVSAEQKKKLLRKLCYPRLVAKIEKAGFRYELTMEDLAYTNLENNAETRTSTITTVVRQVYKGIEYLFWYTIERGYDKNGNEVIGSGTFLQHGLDKDVQIKSIRNLQGEVTKLQLGNVYTDILTEEFTSEKLDQLLNNSELDEHIQYPFTNNLGKSYGGFTAEEMIHLSSKELNTRGQLGKAGEDLSVLYSDLSSKDKLFLQSQSPK
jgi:hypothetical protein